MTREVRIKICARCRLAKPLSEYHIRRASLDGRQAYCIICNIERQYEPGGAATRPLPRGLATQQQTSPTATRPCAAAVFLYKEMDPRENSAKAWRAICTIDQRVGPIHAAWPKSPRELIGAIQHWSHNAPPHAYCCIYAHMGPSGITSRGPKFSAPERRSMIVPWAALARAFARPVDYLWLVGCQSNKCRAAWMPLAHSVAKKRILTTTASAHWLPLLWCFEHEISLSPIIPDGSVERRIRSTLQSMGHPQLASRFKYFNSQLEPL